MSELLDSLTQIEQSANKIFSNADSEKNRLNQEFKEKTLEFDKKLHDETQSKLDSIRKIFQDEVMQEQIKLQKKADDELIRLNKFYEKYHENIVENLVSKVIEV